MYPKLLLDFAQNISDAGGTAWLVGGVVRDEFLGLEAKDFDVEVHSLPAKKVKEIASEFGRVGEIGKAFGVLSLIVDGVELDISLPRTDSKVAPGHCGFDICVDPNIPPAEAVRRRDFTINAIMKNPLTGEIVDPFDGRGDIENKILRIVDEDHFAEDPLRLLRGAQFVARFGLQVDEDSLKMMQGMVLTLKELPEDRIRQEWRKMLTKSIQPSIGLVLLKNIGVIDEYHQQLVLNWDQLLIKVDETAGEIKVDSVQQNDGFDIELAVMCSLIKDEKQFLDSIGIGPKRIRRVLVLVGAGKNFDLSLQNDGQIRQLAKLVYPANLLTFSYVVQSESIRKKAKSLGILLRRPDSVIRGSDLIALDLKPGPFFRRIIEVADRLRDEKEWGRSKILLELKGVKSDNEALERLCERHRSE